MSPKIHETVEEFSESKCLLAKTVYKNIKILKTFQINTLIHRLIGKLNFTTVLHEKLCPFRIILPCTAFVRITTIGEVELDESKQKSYVNRSSLNMMCNSSTYELFFFDILFPYHLFPVGEIYRNTL